MFMSEDGQTLHFKDCFKEKELVKKAGGRWVQATKTWDFAFDLKVMEELIKVFPNLEFPAEIQEQAIKKIKNQDKFMLARKEATDNIPMLDNFPYLKLPPHNYQKHGIICGSFVEGGFLIADEMGLGKSVQSIAIAIERKKQGIQSCLVVCPASVKYNWLNEIRKFTDEKVMVIDGNQADRIYKWFVEGYFFKIVNYDIIVRDLFYDDKMILELPLDADIPEKYNSKRYVIKKNDLNVQIFNVDNRILNSESILKTFPMIIIDEIHYCKTHSSLRSRILKKFKAKYRIGLTGTPIDGRLEELHSIFEFLKPNLFPSKSIFLKRHAEYDWFGGIKGYVKVDEVRERITPYYIRRLKSEVLKELPDKIYKDIYVEMSNEAMAEYNELAKRKHEITKEDEAVVAVIRCRQFCDFPVILDIAKPSAKFEALKELLEEVVDDNKQKVIIFSQYKKVTDLLCKKLNMKYNILTIDGDTPTKKRFDICEQFNNDDRINLMVMTDAGSVGINLQKSTYVIHYDDNYSPAVMNQRNDRCHRIGQKNVVTIIRFICKDTVEDRVREIIDTKQAVNSELLDEQCTELSTGTILTSKEIAKLL